MDNNAANEGRDFHGRKRVTVRVMRTDEEWIIARSICRILGLTRERGYDHENKKDV